MSAHAAPMPAPDADEASRLVRIRFALFLAGFSTFSLIYCVQSLLPALAAEFGVSAATSSLALSLTTGCLAGSIFCAGALSESLGRRGLMAASMCGAAVLNFVAAITPGWHALLVARALEGLVLGGVPAVAMAYLAEEVPAQRLGRAMGLYVAGTAFGGMVGRVAMGALTEWMSWRIAMGAISVAGLVAALLFVWLLPPSRHFTRQPLQHPRVHLRAWWGHLADARLRVLFAVGFLVMGAFVTVYNYMGFLLVSPAYGLSQAQIGLIFLAYVFGMAASSMAGGLADRIGRGAVLVAGAVVLLAGIALTLAHPLPLVIAGVVVITVGFFMVHAVASGWVGRLAARHKGHAASLYLLAYYLGSSVLGSLGGWGWHEAGWSAVAGFSAVLALLTLGAALWLRQASAHEARPLSRPA